MYTNVYIFIIYIQSSKKGNFIGCHADNHVTKTAYPPKYLFVHTVNNCSKM